MTNKLEELLKPIKPVEEPKPITTIVDTPIETGILRTITTTIFFSTEKLQKDQEMLQKQVDDLNVKLEASKTIMSQLKLVEIIDPKKVI